MEMPKPTEHHAKLGKLAGKWAADETLYPSPWDQKGGTAKGRMTARMDMGGFWLISDYEQERNGQVNFRGHGVYGYDPNRKQYSMYWTDNVAPSTEPIWGQWEGDTLPFQHQNQQMGGWNRYVYRFNADGTHTFIMQSSQDGKTWSPSMEGHFRKA